MIASDPISRDRLQRFSPRRTRRTRKRTGGYVRKHHSPDTLRQGLRVEVHQEPARNAGKPEMTRRVRSSARTSSAACLRPGPVIATINPPHSPRHPSIQSRCSRFHSFLSLRVLRVLRGKELSRSLPGRRRSHADSPFELTQYQRVPGNVIRPLHSLDFVDTRRKNAQGNYG
jgi:hypothetical protein